MIKAELREWFGDKLPSTLCERIISCARRKITSLYRVDPMEFKGSSIEFYQSVIRNPRISVQCKLTAQERLDKLLGLETMSIDNPAVYAAKVAAAMKAADGTVSGSDVTDVDEEEANAKSSADSSAKYSADSAVGRPDLFEDSGDDALSSAVIDAGLVMPEKKP